MTSCRLASRLTDRNLATTFDPFNVPFTEIAVTFKPVIDLGSKMRVKFKELSGLLV